MVLFLEIKTRDSTKQRIFVRTFHFKEHKRLFFTLSEQLHNIRHTLVSQTLFDLVKSVKLFNTNVWNSVSIRTIYWEKLFQNFSKSEARNQHWNCFILVKLERLLILHQRALSKLCENQKLVTNIEIILIESWNSIRCYKRCSVRTWNYWELLNFVLRVSNSEPCINTCLQQPHRVNTWFQQSYRI